jgi:hypothetical protein
MSEYQCYEFQALHRPLTRWIAGLPESEKIALLCRLATDHEYGAELLRRFHSTHLTAGSATAEKSRTVAALLDEVERRERHSAARAGKSDV